MNLEEVEHVLVWVLLQRLLIRMLTEKETCGTCLNKFNTPIKSLEQKARNYNYADVTRVRVQYDGT